MSTNKSVFPKRISEPKEMDKVEFEVFTDLSKKNYKRWIIPLVDHVLDLSSVKKGKILDIACGPGFLVKEFAQRSKKFDVYGVDTSSFAIKLAEKNCRGLKNASFKKRSVYDLGFPDKSFDVVVCKDSLHHFDDAQKAIGEMLRVTKKGGVVYIQDLRRDLPKYLFKKTTPPDSTLKKLQFYSIRASLTKREIINILKKLKISNFIIRTRKMTEETKNYYNKKFHINPDLLREGFQARYYVLIKK